MGIDDQSVGRTAHLRADTMGAVGRKLLRHRFDSLADYSGPQCQDRRVVSLRYALALG
jgi:hypothetical protein